MLVFADKAAKGGTTLDPLLGKVGDWVIGPGWAELVAAMGTTAVIVRLVLGQDRPQVPLAEDQHPIRDLGPGREHEPFRIGIGSTPSTTPDPDNRYRRVRVTHLFYPLSGRDFEFVVHRQNWGEDRVHPHDENSDLSSLPAGWTGVAPADPFAVIADGQCPFTVDGLLALAGLISRLRPLPASDAAVKEITP